MLTQAALDEFAADVRRRWGGRLPVPDHGGAVEHVELREEMARDVLERAVMPELTAQGLGRDEHDAIVDRVIAETFGLLRLNELLGDSSVTDVLVLGSDAMIVERGDGVREYHAPLVRHDRDLERLIREVAIERRAPFDADHPFVDVSFRPGVRMHAEGFDVARRPLLSLRRGAPLATRLADLERSGSLSSSHASMLRSSIAAGASIIVCGRQHAGSTTLLRALAAEIPSREFVVTIEAEFELDLGDVDPARHVHAYRTPTGATHDLVRAALSTPANRIVVGGVTGADAGLLLHAMTIGRTVMTTIHGSSARDGIERFVELVSYHHRIDLRTARRQAFRNVGLVVHVAGERGRRRYVTEVFAPTVDTERRR